MDSDHSGKGMNFASTSLHNKAAVDEHSLLNNVCDYEGIRSIEKDNIYQ